MGELHDFLSLVDENPPPWSQDIPDMRNCTGMMCSPFITQILREKACAELTHLLSDPSFPVCGKVTCRHKRMNIIDDCGPGWLLDMYRPEVKVEFYGDTAGYLPERVTCHHVRDVYRLLSALNDAERDIRIRNKTTSLRSWWRWFAGRVQG
ncbi:hypothetical protein L2Z87_003535 [Salmonella enterica]|nr:hypothetical protein [Salmonella enterica]EIT6901354.1 hypothetical protein [Salmonella enterica]